MPLVINMFNIILAQGLDNPVLGDGLQGIEPGEFLARIVRFFIDFSLFVGIIVFLFMLLYGGTQWVASTGDKAKLTEAKGRIVNAIIGIMLLLLFFVILQFIELAADVNLTTLDISSFTVDQ